MLLIIWGLLSGAIIVLAAVLTMVTIALVARAVDRRRNR